MQAILERQTKALEAIEKTIKQDQVVQIAQLYEEKRIDDDSEKSQATLASIDKGIKQLNDKSGDGLNSNVIKLFKEIKKVTTPKRELNTEEVGKITSTAVDRRQFNTLQPRVDNMKENVKDFFTMRGFLDKTGIVKRGSGGIISEYLDRNEAKKKYVDQRMATKGTTFGSRETFEKQFDAQQKLQYEINKNEKEIKRLRESGATDIGLKRSGHLDKRAKLAADIAKVDPSLRPEGFDPKTGKVKVPEAEAASKPETASEQQTKAKSAGKAKIIPFAAEAATAAAGSALSNEESMLEQNRMVAEQSELLKKIEENTRGLKGGAAGGGTTQQPTQEESGLGLMDMLGGKAGRLGKIAKSAGRGLLGAAKTAGSFLMKRAGPLAAVTAVGMGAYEGYKGWTEAGDKQEAAKEDIKAKLAAGEITQGEANQLTKQADETATVEKGGAAGKGAGMAIGGAAGALKGAAAGAAIGSVVPVVGTVVGGAIGATVGAIGGGWLGGKGGEWLGKKAGQAKNWAGGLVDNAKGFFGFGGDKEAAGDKTVTALKKTADGVTPSSSSDSYTSIAGERVVPGQPLSEKQMSVIGMAKSQGNSYSPDIEQQYQKQLAVTPVSAPSTGNVISKASGDNEQAKLEATRGGGGNTVVSAPTINNNTQNQTSSVKLSPRNNDSTVNKYMQSRWAF